MTNVVYLIREASDITLRNLLKYLIRPIFADFSCREGISCLKSDIKNSRDRSAFFVGYLLNMVAREINSNDNNAHIQITYFFLCGELKFSVSRKFSRRFLKRCFYLLRDGVSQIFRNKFFPGRCKNIRHLLKIKR